MARTLLMGTVGTHAINPALYKKLPYDAVRDFTPIALVAMAPVTIVVHPSQPVNNIAELVALAKRMPGKLNYGSAGAGTPGHLTGEMFKSAGGHRHPTCSVQGQRSGGDRPYRRSDPDHVRPTAVGAVECARGQAARHRCQQQGAFASVCRMCRRLPKSGYSGFETTAWWGVFAPAKLPADHGCDRLAVEIERIVRSDDVPRQARTAGCAPDCFDWRAFAEFQRRENWPNGARRCVTPARRRNDVDEAQRRRARDAGRQVRPGAAASAAAPDQGRRVSSAPRISCR